MNEQHEKETTECEVCKKRVDLDKLEDHLKEHEVTKSFRKALSNKQSKGIQKKSEENSTVKVKTLIFCFVMIKGLLSKISSQESLLLI